MESQQLRELERYQAVVRDSSNPVRGVRILTNSQRAADYFGKLLDDIGSPGETIVRCYGRGVSYFLVADAASPWRYTSAFLASAVVEEWTDAFIAFEPADAHTRYVRAVFEVRGEFVVIEQTAKDPDRGIVIDAPSSILPALIVWWRRHVDADGRLLFFDESYEISFEVRREDTVDDIAARLGVADRS